jgi:hypothetical protein
MNGDAVNRGAYLAKVPRTPRSLVRKEIHNPGKGLSGGP